MFDLILRNGTVIDGTGTPRIKADVGVQADRISAIGDLADANAVREFDATDQIVAPGFIDIHNHSDGWLVRERNFVAKTTQGFTTEVIMADGIGYAPVDQHTAREWLFYLRALNGLRISDWTGWETFEEYLLAIDGHTAQNVASHLPYANLRSLACGFRRIAVDDFQMREIQRQICIGMEAGAVGVSTGLDYIVQCFSTTDELCEALLPMSPYNGLYVTHVRYKKGLINGIQEAVEIGKRAGVRVHISHLKGESEAATEAILDYIDKTARHEVDLSFDVYPFQPGSTMLSYLVPYDVWEDGPLAALSRLHDPVIRERFAQGLNAYRLPLEKIRIAWVQSQENAHVQGMMLDEYIEESGASEADALLNLLLEERFAVLLVFDEGDDKLIEPFLQHDLFMMGTDGIFMPGGPVHPRVTGSVGRFLGPLVREKKLMTLEAAIHSMTLKPAERFQFPDRGKIATGGFADLVVFDPETICDQATYENPHQMTKGLGSVIVNGVPVIENEQPADFTNAPGRFLRSAGKVRSGRFGDL